jgi:EAL domain-containing protein (putative c-di-GMP-specific phosphodiesterase class I)
MQHLHVPTASPSPEPDWPALVDRVLTEPDLLQLVFQPIVGLQEAVVVGYEALSRFTGPVGLTPDRWFAAADRLGRGAQLEALVVARCLRLRDDLPPDCFLTVNVSPHLLTQPALADLLLDAGDLHPLVLELTEHQDVADLRPLVSLRDRLADQGALLALDDAGSGYSGLQQMTRLRPHLIKLDRALVADADRDEVKLALAELLGEFAGRIDAWLLAEGVETWSELEAFLRLGVPLAQGYLLGRPAPPWADLDEQTAARLRSGAARARLVDHVASLVEAAPVEGRTPVAPGQVGLRLDAHGRPTAVLVPRRRVDDDRNSHRAAPVSLRVPGSAGVVEVARQLVARPEDCRFDPIVCVDERGRAVGVLRLERILLRLAELKVGG